MAHYDHLILGTGQATGALLGYLIPTGERIAVVEGARVGGSCVNYGCTPTKTLVASARVAHQIGRAAEYGVDVLGSRVDYGRVWERMNRIRTEASESLASWMEAEETVTLIHAWGTFEGPRTVQAGGQSVTADHVYINTGTHPFLPPIHGIEDVPWLDSAGLLELRNLPSHLVILGGGYIGAELGQAFRRFGSEVTILQREDQLIPREDPDVAEAVRGILEKEGIRILLSTETRALRTATDGIEVETACPDGPETLRGSHLLVAAGRRPNSVRLGLDRAGIAVDQRGFIKVDDYCRTTVEQVYAVGDVNGKGAFTHTAVNDAEIVIDLFRGGSRSISQRIPVYALFTDPPLGRVGLSEQQALESGRKVLMATRPMSRINRAREMGETQGFAKLLVDAETDLILGASVLGPGGDEIINMFAAIMHSGIPCRRYREVVLVHPTVAELMPWILDGLEPIN